jgi:hypothetical protein
MAKSKSTTTPIKSSSSKTKDKDHTDGRRSSRANVNTRSASAQSSPSKRKADDHNGSRSSKRRALADNHVTPSTSQQATLVRPATSKGKGKATAVSELELFKERHNSLFPRGVTVKRETPNPEPDPDNICVPAPPGIDPDDREKLLDFVLIEEFGCEARRHAVDQLFQAARRSAASETNFGVPYIEATVSRLKLKGIDEQRLVEVVPMLRDGLMGQFCARVDFLGGPPPSSLPPPPPPAIGQVAAGMMTNLDVTGVPESRLSQKSPVVVLNNGKRKLARSESPSESSDSSSEDDETVVPGSQKHSRYREDDDEDYVEGCNRATRRQEHIEYDDGMTSAFDCRNSASHMLITSSCSSCFLSSEQLHALRNPQK